MKNNLLKIAMLVALSVSMAGCELYLNGVCLGTNCGCAQGLPYCYAN